MSDTLVITSAGVIEGDGYYLNTDGHPSSDMKMQDNHYYQDFSYEIESGVSTNFYKDSVTEYLHPVGTKMFGRLLWHTDIPAMPSLPPSEIRFDYHQDGAFAFNTSANFTGVGVRQLYGVPMVTVGTVADIQLENDDDLISEDGLYTLEYQGRNVGGRANVEPAEFMWGDIICENGDYLTLENGVDTYILNNQTITIGRTGNGTFTVNSMMGTTNVQLNIDASLINSHPLNARTVAEDWREGICTHDGFILTTRPTPQYSRIIG